MPDDLPPAERAEANLNRSSAADAARFERQLASYRPLVLRDGLREEDVAFYNAAIFVWSVQQMVEMLRVDLANRLSATGQGVAPPSAMQPREEALRPAGEIIGSARDYCVREDAIPENVEMYERLVGMQRFRDVTDRARLEVIDAAKAAGAM
jgi:hypothetical protein